MNRRLFLNWFAALSIVFLACSSSPVRAKTGAAPPPPKTLTGAVLPFVANGQAHLLGHHPGTDQLRLAIGLAGRNPQAFDQLYQEITTPGNPRYRHWLTLEQQNQEFNPTPQQEQQVISWLMSNGLTVTHTYPNHLIVDTGGTSAQVEHLLHITINDYQLSGTTFYAPATDPLIDGSVSNIVSSIVGLHNYPFIHTGEATTQPNTNGNPNGQPPYFPQDFANAYDVNPLWNYGQGCCTGSGQSVGIVLWGPAPSENTLVQFHAGTGAAVATPDKVYGPWLQVIPVDSGPYISTVAQAIEGGLDVESSSGIAPGATIDYYEAPTDQNGNPTDQGLDDALDLAGSDANNNQQISSSWGQCEGADPMFIDMTEQLLQSNTITGHTYFFSSGDWGSACVSNPPLCVFQPKDPVYPASSVYATSVGGTRFSGTINPNYPGEVAWKYTPPSPTCPQPAPEAVPAQYPVGSGGGYSTLFPEPYWQTDASISDPTRKRAEPDVAADADPATGAYICFDTQSGPFCSMQGKPTTYIGGTSLASPLWAGMLADINQYLQSQNLAPAGFITPTLYCIATQGQQYTPYHDITSGTNGGYHAGRGWDPVTGWGSPDLYHLAQAMANSSWCVVSSPNPGSYSNNLDGVTATSSTDAWAVGFDANRGGSGQTLIEHWDGSQWSVVPSPNPDSNGDLLTGVTATSSTDAWAVGYTGSGQTLIEHWDGSQWSVVPSPNPSPNSNSLFGVIGLSTTDVWAVGYDDPTKTTTQTLIEHWDGSQWSVVPSPNLNSYSNNLYSVAAVSSTDIWAVGLYQNSPASPQQTLTEHWDGSQWSIVPSAGPSPSSNVLYSVSADSSGDVWAAGNYYNNGTSSDETLIEHWNGSQWSVVPSLNPGSSYNVLNGVTAISSTDAWAVGAYDNNGSQGTLIEYWNGMQWSVVPSPNPGSGGFLSAVASDFRTDVWAVGAYNGNSTLIEHYT